LEFDFESENVIIMKFILIQILLLALVTCKEKTNSEIITGINMEYIGDTDTLIVKAGEKFTIVLKSQASTGYSWHLLDSIDTDLIELLEREYTEEPSDMDGAMGQEIWSFKALSNGESSISLAYRRAWDKEIEKAVDIRKYLIIIE
jgi:predicted secreted protein